MPIPSSPTCSTKSPERLRYLSYNELDLIAGDPGEIYNENLTEDKKTKYNKYVEAWYMKLDEPEPVE
jgi:hypothetical protein